MDITLYTTHCPKCNVLTKKLDAKHISYTECADTEVMKTKGIDRVPVLEVDGNLLSFGEANTWVNKQ